MDGLSGVGVDGNGVKMGGKKIWEGFLGVVIGEEGRWVGTPTWWKCLWELRLRFFLEWGCGGEELGGGWHFWASSRRHHAPSPPRDEVEMPRDDGGRGLGCEGGEWNRRGRGAEYGGGWWRRMGGGSLREGAAGGVGARGALRDRRGTKGSGGEEGLGEHEGAPSGSGQWSVVSGQKSGGDCLRFPRSVFFYYDMRRSGREEKSLCFVWV
jgi:hypothetical protein